MPVSPDRWRLRNLISVWMGYWLTLGAVTLAPLARTLWRISRVPSGGHSSLSTAFTDGVLQVTTIVNGAPGWSGAAHLSTIALWVAGPPLAMWLVWLRGARPRGRTLPFTELLQPERPAAAFRPRDRGEPARAEDAGRRHRDAP